MTKVITASDFIRRSFGQEGEMVRPVPHRVVMRKIAWQAEFLLDEIPKVRHLKEGEEYGYPCSCNQLGWVLAKQQFRRAEDRFFRWAIPQAKECLIASLALQLPLESLRGRGRRREFLEQEIPNEISQDVLPELTRPMGRPRQIFLDRRDYELVRRFIRHARKEGLCHVERSTIQRVVTEIDWSSNDEEWTVRCVPVWWATGVAEGVEAFLATEPKGEPTEAEIRAFLARLLECGERTVRRYFSESLDDRDYTPSEAQLAAYSVGARSKVPVEILWDFSSIDEAFADWERQRKEEADEEMRHFDPTAAEGKESSLTELLKRAERATKVGPWTEREYGD